MPVLRFLQKWVLIELRLIDENIVQPSQTTFMPGRPILEGVVVLHETIHEIHRKMNGVLFKSILKRPTTMLIGHLFSKSYVWKVLILNGVRGFSDLSKNEVLELESIMT
jgi:hypothetical protein